MRPPWRRAAPEECAERTAADLRRWAGLLRAGMTPGQAWAEVGRRAPEVSGAAVGEAQIEAVDASGEGARHGPVSEGEAQDALVAAALHAAERAGAAPAEVARRLADSLEASADAVRARRAAAAGPRATARLLAWLPVGGLGLAWLLGMGPAELLATPLGWVLLVLGGVFSAVGWAWTRLLLARAARPGQGADPAVLLDMLSALLGAGRSLAGALDDVAAALPGAAGLRVTTTLLLWGVDWEEAWAPMAGRPAWERLAEELRPLHRTGMAGAETLAEAAAAIRQADRRADERAAEELAVRLVLPLGLCQLPAFVCWGVAPMALALLVPAR